MKNRIFLNCLVLLIVVSSQMLFSQITINEVMSSNKTAFRNIFYEFEDWVELYNSSDTTVNLEDWAISDDEGAYKWIFPDIQLKSKEFLLLFCSGRDVKVGVELHTNFKLSSSGEILYLYDNHADKIDELEIPEIETDISFGAVPDGSEEYFKFLKGSPDSSNQFSNILNKLEFSAYGGYYPQQFRLSIESEYDSDIYYTTDGSEPTINSIKYTDSITIKSRENEQNRLSLIRTNPTSSDKSYVWSPPKSKVFKAAIIRAATFNDWKRTSRVISSTYFIVPELENRYSFPVISICTDSVNLFGYEKGIYIPGKTHDDNPNTGGFWGSGNYFNRGDEWERPAHIEYFETNGNIAFSQDIGIRIHGSGGRALPEKSLRLYAREEYGKATIDYKFFESRLKNSFKRIILRNSGQDFLFTMFADAIVHDLSMNTGIEFMASKPAIVFINGEYWGIHNIRERYDEYYLQDYCGLSTEDIIIYDNAIIKNPHYDKHFNEFYSLLKEQDITDNLVYEQVKYYIDIFNTVNYFVQKIHFGIYDWPGNNVEIWRPKVNGGRWRWLSYDNDDGMFHPDTNFFLHATAEDSESWRNPPWSTFIFRNLMKNKQFENLFFSTLELRMQTVFSTERVISQLNENRNIYSKEIDEHIARWNYPISREFWESQIERMKNFMQSRFKNIQKHIKEYRDKNNVADNNNDKVIIYPNPATDYIEINITDHGVNHMVQSGDVEIFDVLSKSVTIKTFDKCTPLSGGGWGCIMNISHLHSGVYFVKVGDVFLKFVKI